MTKKKPMEPRIFTFDTHQHVKDLQSAGFNEKQAEVIVKSLLESRDADISHLATKDQVSALEQTTKDRISALDNKINALEKQMATKEQVNNLEKQMATKEQMKDLEIQIAQSQASILKWMIATVIAFSGVIIAAVPIVIKYMK